jgi:GNAT superfamily N-acetyltransferase
VLAEIVEARAWSDMVAGAPPALASALGLRCERRGGATCLVAPGVPAPLLNRAMGLGCTEAASEADLEEILDCYRDARVRRFWIHLAPAARPATLRGWLQAAGLAPDPALPAWAKVIRGPEPPPDQGTSLRVAPVDQASAAEFGSALALAHALPAGFAAWFEALAGRTGWSAYGGFEAGRVVAGGLLFVSGTTAWLGAAGTLPSHRGRGAQGALLARRIREAIAVGCTAIATETGDVPTNPSLRNLARAGFRRVGVRLNYAPVA